MISQIPEILSPETVAKMDDETVNDIAMETESAAWERGETDNRLELCFSALENLKPIENMRASGEQRHPAVRKDVWLMICSDSVRRCAGFDVQSWI